MSQHDAIIQKFTLTYFYRYQRREIANRQDIVIKCGYPLSGRQGERQ